MALISAAVELLAAAVGRHVVIWRAVPLPHSHEGRILVAARPAGRLGGAGRSRPARPGRRRSCSSVEGGSLRLPPDSLERYLAAKLARDPDVVASRAWFALHDERLSAELWVALRPLAPAAVLRERLGGLARAALRDELGLAADVADPVVKVLRVGELPRYLR